MIRKIIHIDQEKCNGCGICVKACHEGAIGMVDGKAKLLRDDYCDGLGDCLPGCPAGAITFEEREAAAYDEAAVLQQKSQKTRNTSACQRDVHPSLTERNNKTEKGDTVFQGCPGSRMRVFEQEEQSGHDAEEKGHPIRSCLRQWPVQIKLAPVQAPFFRDARLLIAADCTAYAYANFHQDFIRGRVVLVGCPKLDSGDYSEKLTEIIRSNEIKSVTIVRMEVPCCGGLEHAAVTALKNSGKFIPWQVVTISTEGRILDAQ